MKKILFCAGLLALAASCAENELDPISGQDTATKGISFEGTLVETPTTKGDLAYDEVSAIHNFFWYAEKDKISIWSTNTTATGSKTGNSTTGWVAANSAKYKATQSKANGVFTAVADDNILDFQWGLGTAGGVKDWNDVTNEQFKSQFIATYPSTVLLAVATADGKYRFSGLPLLANQTQKTLDGQDVTNKIAMISLTKAVKENSYDAVGEKIALSFNRPFTAVVFRTAGINEEYAAIFGNLKTIELEAKGYDENGNGNTSEKGDIAGSYLNYGDAHYLYNSAKTEESKLVKNDGKDITDMSTDVPNASQKITLTLGTGGAGLRFMDSNLAYMAINKIDRSEFAKEKVKETMAMKFSFANIDLPKTAEFNSNWPSAMNNKFIGGKSMTLDINAFPYLVTNKKNARTLIVNKGTFSQIFNDAGNKVKWNDGTPQEYELTQFTNIISKVELTTPELEKLKAFTNVVSIKLAENATIPAETFKDLNVLTSINLPKATTIAKDAFSTSANLVTVIMPAYKFADETINPQILKQKSLVTLDMSGVEQMSAAFPAKGLTLSGYTALKTVTVREGLLLGASSFSGCTALTEIKGAVAFREDGAGAFKDCTSLTKINIKGTVIPADAFNGCILLENVLNNGKQVLPTSVGNQAFMSCAALKEMNLSAATIGEESFKGCTALYGVADPKENNKKIMYVGATTIPFNAFENCTSLEYVHFMNANSFAEDILKGCNLKEVKFKKVFTVDSNVTYTADTFGKNTTTAVKLFINPSQSVKTFNNNTLILAGKGASASIGFLSITKE